MSPDPYAGSYDFSNPQSLNRYTYAGNNPLSATDTSGLEPCDDWWCDGGGEGGDGGDPGGCDPLFYDCDGSGGYIGDVGYGPEPDPKQFVDLDPNHTMTGSLGMPAGMRLPSGDILSIFGVSSGTPCEFGACEPEANTFSGDTDAALDPKNKFQYTVDSIAELLGFGMAYANWGDPNERLFGTHYCGPGGGGSTVNRVDALCQLHDYCYRDAVSPQHLKSAQLVEKKWRNEQM